MSDLPNVDSRLAPDVATRVAENHRSTAGDIGGQQTHFNDAIAGLRAACTGGMIKALDDAGHAWSEELRTIIGELNQMAELVVSAVGAMSSTDADNAGNIGKVGVDILRGI